MIKFLRVLGAFGIALFALIFGAGGGCFVGLVMGPALHVDAMGGVMLFILLGGVVGLIAGSLFVARIFRGLDD